MNMEMLDGDLHLWELHDLEAAEREIDPAQVRSIRIGAKVFSAMQLPFLLLRLAPFATNAEAMSLADDRVMDADMPQVESLFRDAFPSVKFTWTWDGLVAGKHGR